MKKILFLFLIIFNIKAYSCTLLINNPAPVCSPSTINLKSPSITSGSSPGFTFTYWANASATVPLPAPNMVSSSGTFYIKGVDGVGCVSIKPVVVIIDHMPIANAGVNQQICVTNTLTLAANNPSPLIGTWSTLSPLSISNVNSNTSTVTSLAAGTHTLTWTVSSINSCPDATDDVIVIIDPTVAPADAGSDITVCTSSSATMNANAAAPHTGIWSVVSGTGTFANNSDPLTAVSSFAGTSAVLRWTINSGACGTTSDDVTIVLDQVPTGNAGVDQTICESSTLSLAASMGAGNAGNWTYSSGAFADDFDPNTTVTGLTAGTYTFTWTIYSALVACSPIIDNVTILVDGLPTTSNAGVDVSSCGTTGINLSGNTPLVGVGTWTVLSGTATFVNVNDPVTTVSGFAAGTNTLRWTISNGVCVNTFDDVDVNSGSGLAGVTINTTPECSGLANGVIDFTVPSGFTYDYNSGFTYNQSIPSNKYTSNGNISKIENLSGGAYSIRIDNPSGCSTTQTVIIPSIAGPTPSSIAGDLSTICQSSNQASIIMVGNSQSTVSYQLMLNGNPIGSPVTGSSGSPVFFPSTQTSGTYTVEGTLISMPSCKVPMSNNFVLNINPVPTINTITSSCNGGDGTGQLNINASITTGTIQYSLNNGYTWQNSNIFNNLVNGTYTITMKETSTLCSTTSTIKTVYCNLSPVTNTDYHWVYDNTHKIMSNVLINDSDPDKNVIKVQEQKITTNYGIFEVDSFGVYSYEPLSPQTFISDTIIYTVCDSTINSLCTNEKLIIRKYNINSITNIENNNIQIYPNPSTDFINIDNNYEKTILDLFGNIIIKTRESKIDISYLNNGIYTIIINNHSSKFIKN